MPILTHLHVCLLVTAVMICVKFSKYLLINNVQKVQKAHYTVHRAELMEFEHFTVELLSL